METRIVRFALELFRELFDIGFERRIGRRVDILGSHEAFGNLFLAISPRLLTTGRTDKGSTGGSFSSISMALPRKQLFLNQLNYRSDRSVRLNR